MTRVIEMILTREQLHALIFGLADQITFAESNRLLYKRLTELCGEGKDFELVYKRSQVFWMLMCNNMRNEIISNLARLYDEQKDAFGLRRLIEECNKNLSLFPKKCPSTHYDNEGNPEYISPQQVVAESWEVYNHVNSERLKLKKIRNKSISHIEWKCLINKAVVYDEFYWKDVEDLIFSAQDIVSKMLAAIYDEALMFEVDGFDDIDRLITMAMYGYEKKKEEWLTKFSHFDGISRQNDAPTDSKSP